jgi:hypothetical protein
VLGKRRVLDSMEPVTTTTSCEPEATHRQALRQLANRLVGFLHACLEEGTPYGETIAWREVEQSAA